MTDETTPPASPDPAEPPPAYEPAPPPVTPPAPAKQPGKWRVAIPLVIIAGFLGVVLYMTRDNQSADDLAAGTCFDIPSASSVSTVTKHECTEAHDAEVFHNAEYTENGTYPITLSFSSFASANCTPVFATYVGEAFEDSEDLEIGFFYPTSDSWGDGDRTVTCYAYRIDAAKLTQSVKASAGS
jgi:hypothetical protein